MTIFICLDNNNNMMFNNRRQSKDRKIIEDIKKTINESKLCISFYSESLFKNSPINYVCYENLIEHFSNYSYCFIEDQLFNFYEENIDQIIIYKWNRKYPGDFSFNYDLLKNKFKLVSTIDFIGFSHEKITKEVWINDRKEK